MVSSYTVVSLMIPWKSTLVVLSFCLLVSTAFCQDDSAEDTIQRASDTIVHSAIRTDNGFESYFIDQSLVGHLPFRDIREFSLLTPGSFYTSNTYLGFNVVEADGDYIFVDGMQIRSGSAFPFRAIGEMAVFTSEAPLQFGNSVAGFVVVNTPEPDSSFVNLEFLSSFRINSRNDKMSFYAIGNDILEINAGGPLRFGKNSKSDKRAPSFYIAANLSKTNEQFPSHANSYEVNEATLAGLERNPLRSSGTSAGTFENAEFVTKDQFEETRFNSNSGSKALNAFVKINYPVAKKADVSFGSYIQLDKEQVFIYENSMFNSKENPVITTRNFDNYLAYSHQLADGDEFKLSYKMLLNYSSYYNKLEHGEHKDDLFKYGYLGKFTTHTVNSYSVGIDSVTGLSGQIHTGFSDTLYTFEPAGVNPVAEKYTSNYYTYYNNPADYNQVVNGGGLVNGYTAGDLSGNVYNIWNSPGKVHDQYGKTSQQQIRGKLAVDASYKNTEIKLGFEYSRRTERSYQVAPVGLWRRMGMLTNNHILQLDVSNPQPVYTDLTGTPDPSDDTIYTGTINYPRSYAGASQSFFDYNLRTKLGMATNSTDWIDLNALPPETFSMDMFSADDLLNNGTSFVSYYGYDHRGNKLKSKPTLDDFFNQTTSISGYGGPTIYNRSIGAFQPVYINGYVQYGFSLKWLDLQAGLRVDYYDAKQQVLKDQYSLFEIRSAGDVPGTLNPNGAHPNSIDDDFAVYVNNIANPTQIVGYRNGDQWYDVFGAKLSNAATLITPSGIQPYLVDQSKTSALEISSGAFEDYKAVTNVLPSLSAKIRIFKHTQLFIHYHSYTQNPGEISLLRPEQYLFIQVNTSQGINNPALQPTRANKFRIGPRQVIVRNLWTEMYFHWNSYHGIPGYAFVQNAFPASYLTYSNLDVLSNYGATIAINYQSSKNSGLNARVSITAQNSKWRDSPVSVYDAHIIAGYLQFNFGHGRDYVGVKSKNGKRILEDLGLSFFFHYRNGAEYYDQATLTINGYIGNSPNPININNTKRMPSFGLINMKLQKGVSLMKGKMQVQFYVWMQNLLDQRNIYQVHAYTGDPSDDGYLNDPDSQGAIASLNDEESFRDLYSAKTDDPSHFDKPFILRLGTIIGF